MSEENSVDTDVRDSVQWDKHDKSLPPAASEPLTAVGCDGSLKAENFDSVSHSQSIIELLRRSLQKVECFASP